MPLRIHSMDLRWLRVVRITHKNFLCLPLQISIETRYLTVANNFLEEIGVDLDFVFNSGSADFDQAFTGAGAPIIVGS